MNKILIVDDDAVTIKFFSTKLKDYKDDFEVLTANNGQEAKQLLHEQNVSLVITDLQMPEMDGFALLAYMKSNFPDIPALIISAFGNVNNQDKLKEIDDKFQLIEKPVNLDVIIEKIFEKLDTVTKGQLTNVQLDSFLQLIEMQEETCTLTIISGDKVGRLFFKDGDLLDAEAGSLRQEEAAYAIVSWDNPNITILNYCNIKKKAIDLPITQLLMDALRMKDEMSDEDENFKDEAAEDGDGDGGGGGGGGGTGDFVMESMFDDEPSEPEEEKTQKVEKINQATLKAICIKFNKFSGIEEYCIYNEKDNILAKKSKTGRLLEFAPSIYYNQGAELGKSFHSNGLSHVVFSTNGGTRYVLFRFKNVKITVGLKPGINPQEFVKKLNPK